MAFEVHDEFIHPDDYKAPPEDYSDYLMSELSRLDDGYYPACVNGHMRSLYDLASEFTVKAGFKLHDILYASNQIVVQLRLRFYSASEAGVRGVTVIVTLDPTDYRALWVAEHTGVVDLVFNAPGQLRSLTLMDENQAQLSNIRIGDIEAPDCLGHWGMDYPDMYSSRLGVTSVADVQHEMDGTAHVVRHRGMIDGRAVAITRSDLVRFPR